MAELSATVQWLFRESGSVFFQTGGGLLKHGDYRRAVRDLNCEDLCQLICTELCQGCHQVQMPCMDAFE